MSAKLKKHTLGTALPYSEEKNRSSGPRTEEGIRRISEAQKKRWAKWRAERALTAL
nr:hypothetical protein [Gammaproteobacteria bacterium]